MTTNATQRSGSRPIDPSRMEALVGTVVNEIGAAMNAALVRGGDRLGLYAALAAGPVTAAELAARTGTAERYLREWLVAQAASGFVDYVPQTGRFVLSPEQAAVFADEESPVAMLGGFQSALAMSRMEERLAGAFRAGAGIPWAEYDADLFAGTERFFRAAMSTFLVPQWIPALGVEQRLASGCRVADLGCGHGAAAIMIGRAFPASEVVGFDTHAPSIEAARVAASRALVDDRVTFEVADAHSFPGSGYHLVASFDALHHVGDPTAALRHARATLAPEGVLMVVEPNVAPRVEDNFHPGGRIAAAASTLVCTPDGLASGPWALGSIAPDEEYQRLGRDAGFSSVTRVAETPIHRVLAFRD